VRIALEVTGSEATRFSAVRAEAARRLGHSVDDEALAKMLFDAFLAGAAAEGEPGAAPNQVRLTVCERCGATEREAGGEGSVPVSPVVGEAALPAGAPRPAVAPRAAYAERRPPWPT
jgi:hypothetical protein